MSSPFMTAIAAALERRGVETRRFDFGYMAERREGGKRRPPPPVAQLASEFTQMVRQLNTQLGDRIAIGGKSMGGRVASMIADDLYREGIVKACVCLGYPFHPAGKPTVLRTAHLAQLACPTLIVQGERDPLGNRLEVETYLLSAKITFHWLTDGDHDFKPRRASGATAPGNIDAASEAVCAFLDSNG